jgi:hypothetical protein
VAIAQTSPYGLVALLSAAVFLVRTVFMMMGPLLVALAAAFDTSVGSGYRDFLGKHCTARRPGV